MTKRLFDVIMSSLGILITLPILFIIGIVIKLTSKGPVLYMQKRVGKNNLDFTIIKFRTMNVNADKLGLLSFGDNDPRITSVGGVLRKFRLDELPQFFNILKGEMSFVGPRPEVRKYVDFYNEQQRKVLNFKPGVTDFACIKFIDIEDKILHANKKDSDRIYIEEIMPQKIAANLSYFTRANFFSDLKIIFFTIAKTFNFKR